MYGEALLPVLYIQSNQIITTCSSGANYDNFLGASVAPKLCNFFDNTSNNLKGSGYEPNTLVNSIMQALNALMCGDNVRITEGTDAI
ncbi:hypothetical protein F2P81_015002 [Scophthalmus maximus]|uniref:Uncharacterized protein n=1 Tax=Scophthalmus maximus TaxID=52904 RepID=A0A6A4SQV6_SCOMX|nr:hypothetical protein F2P81_015002 [Scophthalmus maximus]